MAARTISVAMWLLVFVGVCPNLSASPTADKRNIIGNCGRNCNLLINLPMVRVLR